jgi:peptidoglycan hydrolase CwlO-like protein
MEEIKNIISNRITLVILLLGFIFCFQVFSFFNSNNQTQKVNYIKKEINALKGDVENIYKSERALGKKIDTFNLQISNLHQSIKINNSKIDNLKKYEKAEIDKFKSYDARMWERYFTERYSKKNISSTKPTK